MPVLFVIAAGPVFRPNSLTVSGYTLHVLARLESPFDLIAEWTAYLPLEVILGNCRSLLATGSVKPYKAATGRTDCVLMPWSGIHWIGRDVVVRGAAFWETKDYLQFEGSKYPNDSPPFWWQGHPATEHDFFEAVARAVSKHRLD